MSGDDDWGVGSLLLWGVGGAVAFPMLVLLAAGLVNPSAYVGNVSWALPPGFIIGFILRLFVLAKGSDDSPSTVAVRGKSAQAPSKETLPEHPNPVTDNMKSQSSAMTAMIQEIPVSHNDVRDVPRQTDGRFDVLTGKGSEQSTTESVSMCCSNKHELTLTVHFESEGGGEFQIPACGQGGVGEFYPFDWNIDWGDGVRERVAGISSPRGGDVSSGSLVHTFGAKGSYEIGITPAEQVFETTGKAPGWLQAFGYPENWVFSVDDNQRFAGYVFPKSGDKLVCVDGVLDDYAINVELEGACAQMFIGCKNITMGPHFTITSSKETAGDFFCFKMFSKCDGDTFTMGDAFQLPRSLCKVGKAFCCKMFEFCAGSAFTMNERFTIPQDIFIAGNSFCQEMFAQHGSGLTMGKSFNLPQGITDVGDNFCAVMFSYVGGPKKSAFTMNDAFNLPPHISGHVGNSFCEHMFSFNDSDSFRMNDHFNLPQGITSAGDAFCKNMFLRCSGSSFSMNDVFTMPPNLQEVGAECCMWMFSGCDGASFHVGSGFDFPHVLNGRGRLCLEMFGECRYASLNWNVQDMVSRNPNLGIWSPSSDQLL